MVSGPLSLFRAGDDQRRVVIVARHEQPLAATLYGCIASQAWRVADAPNGSKTATNATAATILVLIGSRSLMIDSEQYIEEGAIATV